MPRTLSCPKCVYVLVLVAAGAIYGISCAPGALWQDSGLIQYRVWHNDIEGFLGLAIAHPLYYLVAMVAKLVPVGSFGHRVNLVSACAGALAVANLYVLVRLWLGHNVPALLAAATLALSHTFWRHASIAETYTLWTALFLGELIVLLRYTQTRRIGYLYALGLLNGLALAVHMLAVIPGLCYLVLLLVWLGKRTIRLKDLALVAVLGIVGALPYEYLILKAMFQSGDLLGTLASAAFGRRWQGDVLNTHLSWPIIKENVLLILLNFPTPNILLFFMGLVGLRRAKTPAAFRLLIGVLLVLFFVFAFRYTVADRYAFFIPFYVLVCVVVGLGAQTMLDRLRHRGFAVAVAGCALLPIAAYALIPVLMARANLTLGTRGDVPYRDDVTYFVRPWKTGYRGAEQFAREALEAVPAEAVIYADTTTVGPLLYAQEVQGRRPDVAVITGLVRSEGAPPYGQETFEPIVASQAVYVTSQRPGYCPAFIRDAHGLVEDGLLWRVVRSADPD